MNWSSKVSEGFFVHLNTELAETIILFCYWRLQLIFQAHPPSFKSKTVLNNYIGN